jgi:diadenosine tetraphosphate (Ap4A) HIT family hydrolase
MFTLHPQLAADTVVIEKWPLSQVLLCRDANYPWCILVPQREHIREIHHLTHEDRHQLLEESCCLAEVMERLYLPTKINVAALGNVVPQLHLHHVARFEYDVAWPQPIWGVVDAKAYHKVELAKHIKQLTHACRLCFD